MDLWPNFRSPLMWDVFAIGTYFVVSVLFWYVGMIPDLATLRDRAATRGRTIMYGVLALGWRGSARHWHRFNVSYLLLAGLALDALGRLTECLDGDLATLLGLLHARSPARPLFAIGISVGGNVLLKWLGENPEQTQVQQAVAVSVPFDLNKAALRLQSGVSRLYQAHLLRKLRRSTRAKAALMSMPVPVNRLDELRTFRAFDNHVTAPLHGFADVDDYYRRSSSRQFLKHIRTPTLILHALDDPFMTPDTVPAPDELGADVTMELSTSGGHVGFVGGRWPWRACYWLDLRICKHFTRFPRNS